MKISDQVNPVKQNELKNVSVSCGTLRTDDLIEAFMGVLEEIAPQKFADLSIELGSLVSDKEREQFLNVLFDVLNSYAPIGYYFGSHPMDNSDLGFWIIEEEMNDD